MIKHFNQLDFSKLPEWAKEDRFLIDAKAEGPVPPQQMDGPMLQVLLEKRFGVRVHKETREEQVYVLTVAKGGAKIKPSDCIEPDDLTHIPGRPKTGPQVCGTNGVSSRGPLELYVFTANGMLMERFVSILTSMLGRKTIDRTGMTGKYDFHLEYQPEEVGGSGLAAAVVSAIPQLGLKLTSEKGPVDYVVVDSVQHPTVN